MRRATVDQEVGPKSSGFELPSAGGLLRHEIYGRLGKQGNGVFIVACAGTVGPHKPHRRTTEFGQCLSPGPGDLSAGYLAAPHHGVCGLAQLSRAFQAVSVRELEDQDFGLGGVLGFDQGQPALLALSQQPPLRVNQMEPAVFNYAGISDCHGSWLLQGKGFNGRGEDRRNRWHQASPK